MATRTAMISGRQLFDAISSLRTHRRTGVFGKMLQIYVGRCAVCDQLGGPGFRPQSIRILLRLTDFILATH